jgi:hypothetical protein
MENMKEKVSYLKGLSDGLGITHDTKEGKLLLAIIDVLDDMSIAVTAAPCFAMKMAFLPSPHPNSMEAAIGMPLLKNSTKFSSGNSFWRIKLAGRSLNS